MDKQQEILRLQKELHEYMPPLILLRPANINIKCYRCKSPFENISADTSHYYYYPGRIILYCKQNNITVTFCDLCGIYQTLSLNIHNTYCRLCKRFYCSDCLNKSYCCNLRYSNFTKYGQVYDDHCDISPKDITGNNDDDRIDMLKRAIEYNKTALLKPAGRD